MNLVDNATACDGEPRQSQHVYVVFEIEIVFEIEMFCTIWLVLRLAIITSQPKRVSFAVQVIGWLLRRDNPLSSISLLVHTSRDGRGGLETSLLRLLD